MWKILKNIRCSLKPKKTLVIDLFFLLFSALCSSSLSLLSLSQESAAQSASSEENAASEITKKMGMYVTLVHVS